MSLLTDAVNVSYGLFARSRVEYIYFHLQGLRIVSYPGLIHDTTYVYQPPTSSVADIYTPSKYSVLTRLCLSSLLRGRWMSSLCLEDEVI